MHVNLCRAVAGFLATTALGLGTFALAAPPTGGTGPGGFTLTGATSDMVLWTQAGSIGGADGSAVTAWGDLSGRTNNLGNPIVSGAGITYETNEANGLSAVQFQSNSALRNVNAIAPLVSGQSGDWFVVMRTPDDDGVNGGGFHRTGTSSNQHTTWGDGNVYENFATDNRYPDNGLQTANPAAVLSDYHIYNVYGRNNTTGTAADPAWAYAINGTTFGSKVGNGVTSYFAGVNQWEIGRGNYVGDDPWNGHLAEMVMFNRVLNMAERHIVENSLHAKFNLPAPLEAATDFYSGDTGPNGNFDSEVFGVGRVIATNVTPTLGSGAGGFGIAATAGLDDGEFVLAGHKVATNAATTANLGSLTGERWTREWFVDSNGDAVTLQLAFDFATDNIPTSDNADSYQLLFRADESTDYQILAATGQISGNQVLFNNIDSLLLDGNLVTLGINVQAVPEPATIAMWSLLGVLGLTFAWRQRRGCAR